MLVKKERQKLQDNQLSSHKNKRITSTSTHNTCGGYNACHQMTRIHAAPVSPSWKGSDDGKSASNFHKPCEARIFQRNLGNSFFQSLPGQQKAVGASTQDSASPVIQRKCNSGGSSSGCGTMEDEFLSIQPKLKVGPVNDIYEQEADRVADKVMKMPQPQATQNSGIYSGNQVPYVNVQRNATHQTVPSSVPSIVHKVLRSPGQRIDTATRVFMESRFGQDFSDVRIHTDKLAAESAQSINALAYTVGGDVVFGTGQYAPGITKGKQLLAHELTHVIQQGGSENSNPMIRPQLAMTEPGDRFETEADRASTLVTSDERIHISNRLNTSEAMIARSGDCPSTFELVWKCGLGVIGCVATVLAGIAVSPTGIGLAAAILAVIAACGGAGTVCGELLGKYVTCNWPPDRSRAQAELENPVTTEMAEVAV